MTKNYRILFSILAAGIIFISGSKAFAIGEFALGVNIGATRDPNYLEGEITKYNTAMEVYKQENSGTEVSPLSVPYSPVYGFNIRYLFNFFLVRLGCHFTRPVTTIKGSITPAGGEKNVIRIISFQNSFPLTIGLVLPVKDKTYFYLGFGPTYHQAYVKITQSKPEQTSALFSNAGLSTNRRDRYAEDFIGYHIMMGVEIHVYKKFTISTEWIHQEGRSYPLQNGGKDINDNDIYTPKRIINVRGDFILFGLNYYIRF